MLEVDVGRIASTRLRHVRALMAEGRFEEALALADLVLDSDPLPVVADELAMVRASVALVRGDLDAAIASADTVLSQANPVSDHYTEAQVVRLIASMADGSISRGLGPAISLLAGILDRSGTRPSPQHSRHSGRSPGPKVELRRLSRSSMSPCGAAPVSRSLRFGPGRAWQSCSEPSVASLMPNSC
jgi:hypothetical protein